MIFVVLAAGVVDRASGGLIPGDRSWRVGCWAIAGVFVAIDAVWLAKARTPIVLDREAGTLTRGYGGPVICVASWG